MAWLNRDKAPLSAKAGKKVETPDGVWEKCRQCQEVIFRKNFERNLYVCPKCEHHFPCPPWDRIHRFLDPETFTEMDAELRSNDPLGFSDTKPYKDRLAGMFEKTGNRDAIVTGHGKLFDRPILIGVFDFRFLGGSMGSVVGEKIARLFDRSVKERLPAVIFSSSGGARMQEGILSLMQMAKTCTALTRLRENGIPFISVLCHPTTGGVAASFATLGDINIGEPKALIGFAGPRVIQQTIREELPEGFQTAEYLLEHGMLDMIVHRRDMRKKISLLLNTLCHAL